MTDLVYLNGDFVPGASACVSVMDRGFLFGDSVYEVIPAYAGRPFRLEQHIERLTNSLAAIRMANPLSVESWAGIFDRLLAQQGSTDQSIYLQVSRGAAAVRDHAFDADIIPNVLVMARAMPTQDKAHKAAGIAAITLEDIRWGRCDIKATTLLANVLARQQAVNEGAQEAILVRDGQAMEGAASNLFIVNDGLIITPPKGPHILPGITRDLVLELASEAGLPMAEASIDVDSLQSADEIWVTSSTKEVVPVVRLNGRPVAGGQAGPMWARMNDLYESYKSSLRLGTNAF